MSDQLAVIDPDAKMIEKVLIEGDLSKLDAGQRVGYYKNVCESVGLNPLTKPFEYIKLNNKLTLYAKKDATDQLRNIHGVSIDRPDIQISDGLIIVTISGTNKHGRSDADVGVVKETDMRGDKANAIMKAVTKAKRRLTLSLCGLGWLDETEVETIPSAKPVRVQDDGEIVDGDIVRETTKPQTWNVYDEVVKAGLSENEFSAKNALKKCATGYNTAEKAITWMRKYRAARDSGNDSTAAAEIANTQS